MTAGAKEYAAFRDYLPVLSDLERAFRFAGEEIEFRLALFAGKERYAEIRRNGKPASAAFIGGGSPAQALKDVARAVIL
ncbi:MAG: hypothetical protein LBK13_06770 [Spirochaetales bacterium]|jgi:hypothetical protein|nr:hypothetical protein [Spirochaetales bacterium]